MSNNADKVIASLRELRDHIAQMGDMVSVTIELFAGAPEPVFPVEKHRLLYDGICLSCGKRIANSESTSRGCHKACYVELWREIGGDIAKEYQAITEGRIAPVRYNPKKVEEANARLTPPDHDADDVFRKKKKPKET